MRLSSAGIGLAAVVLVLAGGAAPRGESRPAEATPYHDRCITCHERDGAPAENPSGPGRLACVRCHQRHAATAGSGSARGGHPVPPDDERAQGNGGGQRCVVCHDPHRPRARSMLRAPETSPAAAGHGGALDAASRLCLDCHPRHADWGRPPGYRRHPVGLPVSSERIRRDAELPLPLAHVEGEDGAARRVVACTTCHEVHRSRHENLLRWDQQEFVAACTTCHPKDAGRRPQPEVTTLSSVRSKRRAK